MRGDVHCSSPFSAIDAIWFLVSDLILKATRCVWGVRHRFISLGGGIVYSWRPQLHFPVIVWDIIGLFNNGTG